MLIGCQRGICCAHHSTMSVTSRIAGSTGKHHSFCAMYSLRMSVWIVPAEPLRLDPLPLGRDDVEREHDRRRRVDRHRHRDLVKRDPVEKRLHVSDRVDRHPLAAHLAQRARMVRVMAHQRRHVKRRRQAGLPVLKQIMKALVGLRRGTKAGELPHRPQPPPVHRRIHPARKRILARQPDRAAGVVGKVTLRIERRDLLARQGRERARRAPASTHTRAPLLDS